MMASSLQLSDELKKKKNGKNKYKLRWIGKRDMVIDRKLPVKI